MPWQTSDPDAFVPPTDVPIPGVPGDICPQGWENDFDRSQMSTQVLIGRQAPAEIPVLNYDFPGSGPPTLGQATLNGPQSEATQLSLHKADTDGTDATLWLRYLKPDDSIRFADADDTGTSLTYRLTGTPAEYDDYFDIPVLWQSGQTPVPAGVVAITLTLRPEAPELYIDTFGRDVYGVETLSRTDLLNTSKDLFVTLADRILEVRGSNSVPRTIEAVTLDARTGDVMATMEMMSTCRPERPSRYRMRLEVEGRPIFDRMCFASNVRHFISRDEWTLRIALDVAEWAGVL